MSITARLIAYLVLPLLLSSGSFLMLRFFGEGLADSAQVSGIMLAISLLIGLLPALLFRIFVHSQMQQGFAHMEDGSVRLPHELGLADLAGYRIRQWQGFEQLLSTRVRLHGSGADLLVDIRLLLTLAPDKHGKKLARHFDQALAMLERAVQESLFSASRLDDGMSIALDGSTLLNEEDERVLKSKFLSTLETLSIEGVFFPHETSGIHIDRNVGKERHAVPERKAEADEFDSEELLLDPGLLKSAGMA